MARSERTAKHPFDIRAADVVFRTADGVDFYVYKVVLALASPFFADMFSLRNFQPSDDHSTSNEPIVIPEDSDTLDKLLRFCYPVEDPIIDELRQTELVLRAAIKYQVSKAISNLRTSLLNHISTQPSAVFALACRLQLEDVACAAAVGVTTTTHVKAACKYSTRHLQEQKRRSCAEYSSDMGDIPAGAIFRLNLYRAKNIHPTHFISPQGSSAHRNNSRYECDEVGSRLDIHEADVDVTLRSLDGVDFPFYRLLLRLSGADRLLEAAYAENGGQAGVVTASQVTRVGLGSGVLRDLLRLCHPSSRYELDDPYRLWQLSQVAIKYDMALIVETLRKQATRLISTRPLAICLAAIHNGWRAETKAAARALVGIPTIEFDYEPILEDIPASLYHSLLTYHSTCIKGVLAVIQEQIPEGVLAWESLWGPGDDRSFSSIFIPPALVEKSLRLNFTASALPDLIASAKSLDKAITKKLEEIRLDYEPEGEASAVTGSVRTNSENEP